MKYMFASDIHGSAYYCGKVLDTFETSGAERLILLGDLLYHGPRNDQPRDYEPKQVFAMLNEYKDRIWAVRGNCDSEVDQMVLQFPMMADYAVLVLNLQPGDALIFGHIHLPAARAMGDKYLLNPGSAALPKGGNPPSYAVLDENEFTIYDFDGGVIGSIRLI